MFATSWWRRRRISSGSDGDLRRVTNSRIGWPPKRRWTLNFGRCRSLSSAGAVSCSGDSRPPSERHCRKYCHQADAASRLGGVAAKMASRGCGWTLASRQRFGAGGIHELSDVADYIGVTSVNSRAGPLLLPVGEFAVQCLDQGLDGQQPAELTAFLVEHLLLDVKPLADLQQHSNDLGRLAFSQQVDLKIQMRAPVRKFAHAILLH